MNNNKEIQVVLDPKNDPPQYFCRIMKVEKNPNRINTFERHLLSETITQIAHPGGKLYDIEKALVQAAIPELEKLYDEHHIRFSTIICSSSTYYKIKDMVSYKPFSKIYLNFTYDPNKIKKLKQKGTESKEQKNTEIILLQL